MDLEKVKEKSLKNSLNYNRDSDSLDVIVSSFNLILNDCEVVTQNVSDQVTFDRLKRTKAVILEHLKLFQEELEYTKAQAIGYSEGLNVK